MRHIKGQLIKDDANFRVSVERSDLVRRCKILLEKEKLKAESEKKHNEIYRKKYRQKFDAWLANADLNKMAGKLDDEAFERSWSGSVSMELEGAPVFDRTKILSTADIGRAEAALRAAELHRRPNVVLTVGQAAFYFGPTFGRWTRVD